MFNLRRFTAVNNSCVRAAVAPTSTTTSAAALFCTTTTPSLFNSSKAAYTQNTNNNNNRNNNNNNRGNNNNMNNNNNNMNRNYKDENVIQPTPTRLSSFSRNAEPFCELIHPGETAADGYRLIVAFPSTNCTYVDIQYSFQLREKTQVVEAEDSGANTNGVGKDGKPRRSRLFGMPTIPLTVRLYPLQMARVISVLEGKATETVIHSHHAGGTFSRNTTDGTITYSIQTKGRKQDVQTIDGTERPAPTSVQLQLTDVHAFMLEKFLTRVMVMGFDPSRETAVKNRLV